MAKKRIITESQKEYYDKQRKEYNEDKISIKILKSTHKKIKEYCKENNLLMKDFVDEI